MEIRAYNEDYLPYAMENLAVMMDYGINGLGIPAETFFYRFLASSVAGQFEIGNPGYLAGHSGIELADMVVGNSGGTYELREERLSYGKSPEFWAGWVLAYYQWRSGRTFVEMLRNGLGIAKVIAMYSPLHEADPEKFADVADGIIAENSSLRNPLKEARERMGMTQKELADCSGISLRMIRAYEQKRQDMSRAEFRTVTSLARILKVAPESLA